VLCPVLFSAQICAVVKVLIAIKRELKSKAIVQIVLSAGLQCVVIMSIEP
jgi:hypothetical protein